MKRTWMSTLACAAVVALGCGSESGGSAGPAAGDKVSGSSGALGGGQITTWATSDGKGGVTEVGVTLPLAVLDATTPNSVSMEFPDVVKSTTFLQHVYFNLEPNGHPPQPYLVPHVDMHFDGISQADREAIDCAGEVTPSTDSVPPTYIIPGLGDDVHGGTCVPKMGVHAVDVTSPELDQKNPQPFTKTMILGYHKGALIFLEPMVANTVLQAKQAFSVNVPKPTKIGKKTRWPSKIEFTFDATASAWKIVATGFADTE